MPSVEVNVNAINGNSPSVGAGAVDSGTLRQTQASDSPLVAAVGAISGAAVVTDANGTLQQYLRGLVKRWADALGAGTAAAALRTTLASDDPAVTHLATANTHLATIKQRGLSASVTHTRASNTNTYGANDVLGPTGGGTASMNFALGAISGSHIMIRGVTLERHVSALISGETTYVLHLYNVTQPSAQADEATFDLAAGDRASYLGNIAITTPVDLGATLFVEVNNLTKIVKLSGTGIFGVLVTVGTYAAASASVLKVTLYAEQM